MPSSAVKAMMIEVAALRKALNDHLLKSAKSDTKLDINTWLTGLVLAALIGKIISGWF